MSATESKQQTWAGNMIKKLLYIVIEMSTCIIKE